ncbi:LamB/YcsF family protein [Nocardioides jiangxiensis]|uniref:5-oxoprolinase subunit PxpA n=1 Tax=Nocardioides jiangxiensis TaxID=3064524 RepID=A0ABT9B3I8_9ACTN|nr:5-oxoprolinase subunit PxpA [Nocardioides sp. WY-20]MDO7869419.1 5-oxoprolinase subunit PxpA [Nocardioides sp. WY-20]
MTRRIDLNADLGEEITDDAALLAVVTSANVACGYHAGTPETMRRVCEEAARRGVAVGAQVSYLDREHFGRRPLDVEPSLLREHVFDQVGQLCDIAEAAGTTVSYVKPHGALYNRVVTDADQAAAVLAGSGDLPVLGLPGGVLLALATEAGRAVWREGFPDRGYTSDGRLVPRDQPGALVHDRDEVAANAVRLAESVDSVCVHGDSVGAVAAAVAVRRTLEDAGWVLEPFGR